MSQAEELLNSLSTDEIEAYLAEPTVEPHIVIDSDRRMRVPEELRRIAVQYDHNIETVVFDCPRYWDEHDLSTMNIYINYMRADNKPGSYKADNVRVDALDENIMHFDWTITRNASEKIGTLNILVCAKTVDEYGNEENHWNSELCSDMYVSEGLECSDIIVSQHSDVIEQLLVELETIKANRTNNINVMDSYFPFKAIDFPLNELNETHNIYRIQGSGTDAEYIPTEVSNCSPITKCPKYLGIRIEGAKTRVYLYIGDLVDETFIPDTDYHINTVTSEETGNVSVNYLRDVHSRFIKIDNTNGPKYFYYKIADSDVNSKVTIIGGDTFPESEIISTTPQIVYTDGTVHMENENYYSIVLPSGCFYAILNNKTTSDIRDIESNSNFESHPFSVSYELPDHSINIIRGASFGTIPEDSGAALIRLPKECNLNDLVIYTSKTIKSNSNSGRRSLAKEIGKKLIKDFNFESTMDIVWNDSTRPMTSGRRFYGVPYSSRWINSHYVGFEVTPETFLNALNDPYSIAYDGGYRFKKNPDGTINRNEIEQYIISGKGEIINEYYENGTFKHGGGTGYGLVCSAFTSLMCGNPYPQTNRGYTFDSNFTLENTIDMNSGEVLVKETLTHCVFVDEIYDDGYSLYEAVDPCIAKTTHTCKAENVSYVNSKVRTNYIDKYPFSVTNKDTSGYNKLTDEKFKSLLDLDIEIADGSVRPWRGNKSVYGPWDIVENGDDVSGIGVTLHNPTKGSFYLIDPLQNRIEISSNGGHYVDITEHVTANGTYTVYTDDDTKAEQFRFYNHDTVQLTFDAEGKAVFKFSDGDNKGEVADDVEYVYVEVKGYGGAFGKNTTLNQEEVGPMVIAKGNYYPDLALDTSRITEVRAAIVSDVSVDESLTKTWGKFSCRTSQNVVSEYIGKTGYIKNNCANAVKGNVNGSVVRMDDVSPVEHDIECFVHGKNLFDISTIPNTSRLTNNGDSLTIAANSYSTSCTRKLSQCCPSLKVGDVVTINFTTDGDFARLIHLNVADITWARGTYNTITQEMLDSLVSFYGYNNTDPLYGNERVISNIQFEYGTKATEYEPYIDPSTVTVTACGKNMFDASNYTITSGNIDVNERNGNSHTVQGAVGTSTNSYSSGAFSIGLPSVIPIEDTITVSLYVTLLEQGVWSNVFRLWCVNKATNFVDYRTINLDVGVRTKVTASFSKDKADSMSRLSFYVNNNKLLIELDTLQIENGNSASDYESYTCSKYIPTINGNTSITSISPTTTIYTDTAGVNIDATYNRDINKAIFKLIDTDEPDIYDPLDPNFVYSANTINAIIRQIIEMIEGQT